MAFSTLEAMMPFYRMPDGDSVHINFGGKRNRSAPRPCGARRPDGTPCAVMAGYQCDWKRTIRRQDNPGMSATMTCDRHLCEEHAFEIEPDKHLCPEHVETYRAWLRDQAIAY